MLSQNNHEMYEKKKRVYNIVLNSLLGGASPTTGSTFFVDWSILPEGEYKVSFTFSSNATGTDLTLSTTPVIYLELGQASTTVIEPSAASANTTYRGGFLGCLRGQSITSTTAATTEYYTFLYADTNTNPPVYLLSRPRNNTITVDIHTSSATLSTNYTPIGAYVLTLSFELQC
jgi:hypothetical protein